MSQSQDPLSTPIDFRRIIREANGHEWLVREITNVYDRRSSTALIFERPEVIRKVRAFPANWRTMSNEELIALSLRT